MNRSHINVVNENLLVLKLQTEMIEEQLGVLKLTTSALGNFYQYHLPGNSSQ